MAKGSIKLFAFDVKHPNSQHSWWSCDKRTKDRQLVGENIASQFQRIKPCPESWWLFPVPVLHYIFYFRIKTIQNLKYQMPKLKIVFKAKPQLTSQIEFLIYNSNTVFII